MFCTYGVCCYVMGGGGGGTVVSVNSFCILYVLLFDDFLQSNLPIYKRCNNDR